MSPKLIPSSEYIDRLVRDINRSHRRICVAALIVQQLNDTSPIIRALIAAATRGVDVSVTADFSTYSYLAGHMRPRSIYHHQVRAASDMVHRLNAHGVQFRWLGMHHPFFFAGRTHSKWCVIDDIVYCFGGINLHGKLSGDTDFMFRFHDATLANLIAGEHHRILATDKAEATYRSRSIKTRHGIVHIDGGLIGDSGIYRRAQALADQASSILLVTQYAPVGTFARRLKEVRSQVYYNQPARQESFTRALIHVGQLQSGLQSNYMREAYLHAKYMIVTDADGLQTALTGSHNFVPFGGWFGTREIALETQDPDIIRQLIKFYEQHVA